MRAVITGAASGIGRAVAFALAQTALARGERPRLLLVDYAAEGLTQVVEELRQRDVEAISCVADLAVEQSASAVGSEAQRAFGGLDVLVSNAGVLINAPLAQLETEQYERTFAINTRATWLLAKACYSMLKSSRGALVATASVSAEEPTPPHGVYSASKAALVMLVRQLAFEWGPDGIRCNCVSPGSINTGMTRQAFSDSAIVARRAMIVPMRRVGQPEDVANVIAFLAGPGAAYITGVNLSVDGGLQTALMPTARLAAAAP